MCLFVHGQSSQDVVSSILERFIEENDESIDIETYAETLEHYLQYPIDIQYATYEELSDLFFLSEQQIATTLEYISKRELYSFYELQVIPSMDLNTIKALLPFIQLNKSIEMHHISASSLFKQGRHQLYFRYAQSFPRDKLYTSSGVQKYEGNAAKLYTRYKYFFGKMLSYGITGEKDAGEAFLSKSNPYGFDFYSAHFFYRPNKKIKALALIDYQLNLGQGLVMWSGFGTKKSSALRGLKKNGEVIRPYTSVGEVQFLRGLAFTVQHKSWTITPFISAKRTDANLSEDQATIQLSGLHRTSSEIDNKLSLWNSKWGARIRLGKTNRFIATNVLINHYNKKLTKSDNWYKKFQNGYRVILNASLDYNMLLKGVLLFGEEAISISPNQVGIASLNGVILSPSRTLDIALIHRFYGKQYQSNNFVKPFGENSAPNNEHGLYLGFNITPNHLLQIEGYADFYSFHWLKFQASAPSFGREFRIQTIYTPNKLWTITAGIRNEKVQKNTSIKLNHKRELSISESNQYYIQSFFPDNNAITINEQGREVIAVSSQLTATEISSARFFTWHNLYKLRFQFQYKWHRNWTMRVRTEWATFQDQINLPSKGILLYQDIVFKPLLGKIDFTFRFSIFHVEGYDARIYAYENDVRLQHSIPSFSQSGLRYYINMHYSFNENLEFWIRLAQTSLALNVEEPKINTALKAQFRWQF